LLKVGSFENSENKENFKIKSNLNKNMKFDTRICVWESKDAAAADHILE